MEQLRYMVRKGHHGRKDDDGNTVISKPGDPILLSEVTAKKLGDAVRPWPADEPWPLDSPAAATGQTAAPLKTTQGPPKVVPTAKPAAKREDDGHQIKESPGG